MMSAEPPRNAILPASGVGELEGHDVEAGLLVEAVRTDHASSQATVPVFWIARRTRVGGMRGCGEQAQAARREA